MTKQSTPRASILALLGLAVIMGLSLATNWSETFPVAKQFLFPGLSGAVGARLLRGSQLHRLGIPLALVLATGLLAALQSNGFDWRMDDEWDLVTVSLLLSAGSTFAGFRLTEIQTQRHPDISHAGRGGAAPPARPG